ncbi:DUF3726 domain-containing protein [Paracoccaceae bacterium]|nr:DUF3726 domain-containing protein [Paracoccaceae bacterium]
MNLSFSELKDLVFNASLGSNLSAGIGEDLSLAVTFLESRSLPGGKEFLNSLKCERHPLLPPKQKGSRFIFCNARAIFEGVTAIDFLVSEVCESVVLKNIDSQMLLLGLASNYRESSFSFYKNKELYASIFNDELICKHENYKSRNDIEIYLNDSQLDNPLAKCTRMSLDENTFQELIKLASNMLVPESELSRETGAGAGNIDND